MNQQEEQVLLTALRRAEALELRWQDERAQRQRASELFYGDAEDLDQPDDDADATES